MNLHELPGAPFDLVLDVGGNIGEFAEQAFEAWPAAKLLSFEPIPGAVDAQRARSQGRWEVREIAISDRAGSAMLGFCVNQHTASSLHEPGSVRRHHFGVSDRRRPISVQTETLDHWIKLALGRERILVKIDVEGHELQVLQGGPLLLSLATTVVCEVQNDPQVFLGAGSPAEVNAELVFLGLQFAGLAGALLSPSGQVLQFDGIWTRAEASTDAQAG